MTDPYGGASASLSLSSSSNSSLDDTDDDQAIARILLEEENLKNHGKLGKMLSHLDSIPHTPRVNGKIPDVNDATLDHDRLSERLATYDLAELQMEGDGNCQFRALADQLFHNPEYHKHVRKQVVKQLKHHRRLYEGYVPMKYKSYLKMMKRLLGEWGDHLTLQAAADRFSAKICLVTSFRDTYYIEIIPKDTDPSREIWLSFWSEVHYNSLYERGAVPARTPKKKHWYYHNITSNTLGVLKVTTSHGVKTLIYSGTCATYGEPKKMPITEETPQAPINPYGKGQEDGRRYNIRLFEDFQHGSHDLEIVCHRKGFPACMWHVATGVYFNVIGSDPEGRLGEAPPPEQHEQGRISGACVDAARGIIPGLKIRVTDYSTADGTCFRDYIDVTDLVDAHVKALAHARPIKVGNYNVGTGKGSSVTEFVEACKRGAHTSAVDLEIMLKLSFQN